MPARMIVRMQMILWNEIIPVIKQRIFEKDNIIARFSLHCPCVMIDTGTRISPTSTTVPIPLILNSMRSAAKSAHR